jgi:C-terminal processing protease CtpA/Prc
VQYFHGLTWLALALVLSACGGGSGGSATNNGGGTGTGWVKGQFSPATAYAAMCAAPRTGVDPFTQKAYLDRQGTALDEKNWLRSWTNDLYLWSNEVPDQDPATFASDDAYFKVLKTPATTSTGANKDKFHYTYLTSKWESLSQSGVSAGYGVTFVFLKRSPPRSLIVGFVEASSPAAYANLARGAQILTIDGADLVNANDQASVDILNAGIRPATLGESHTFTVLDEGATVQRTVTLMSAQVTVNPVPITKVIPTATGMVGYVLFNDHLSTSEKAMVDAFTSLQAQGVTDLVLDIRYNGGGLLNIASEVAYMIAGPSLTTGQTFELIQFNSKNLTINPVTGKTIMPTPFLSTTQGFSTTSGQPLPHLNLSTVYVLTSAGTCSASESIINGLQGVNIKVVQVGSTTCGKPYAFYPTDNCGVTYFSIQIQGVNAKSFGSYQDGFSPANTLSNIGTVLPGCSVADDFAHAVGDPAEGMLVAALSYQANGICPTGPTGQSTTNRRTAQGYSLSEEKSVVVKSVWQQNRIYRPENFH